jgi:hypothetical protein
VRPTGLTGLTGLILVAACGAGSAPSAEEPAAEADIFAEDPLAAFGGLEQMLTEARRVEVTAVAESIGPYNLHVTSVLDVEREYRVAIELEGSANGTPVELRWTSHDLRDHVHSDVQAPIWADGVLIGLTRMGVLHNLALLIGGADPETGNGDIRTWVEVDAIAWKNGDPASRTLTFDIIVAGIPSAEAELTLDGRGLPLRREQVVHFEGGEMRVIESYDRFVVE